jgi:hypothetical protein
LKTYFGLELLGKRSATVAAWLPLYSSERFKTTSTYWMSCPASPNPFLELPLSAGISALHAVTSATRLDDVETRLIDFLLFTQAPTL